MRKPDSFIGGFDIGSDDGGVAWDTVKTGRTLFTMVKASEGEEPGSCTGSLPDPMFLTHVKEAYRNGLRVGAYHFLTASTIDSAREQGEFFISQLKTAGHMINFYCGIIITQYDDIDKAFLFSEICAGIVQSAGYKPVLYAPLSMFQDISRLSCDLWLPYYEENFDDLPKVIQNRTVIWQHKPVNLRGLENETMRSALIRPEVLFTENFNPFKTRFDQKNRPTAAGKEAMNWAVQCGILRSEDGVYNAKEIIRREEFLILLRRFSDLWRATHTV